MNTYQSQSPRRSSGTTAFALLMGALLVLAGVEASAGPTGQGARPANSGRMAQSSVAGANRTSRNNNINNNVNKNNYNRNGNVNIGNDVNIDVDADHHHGWGHVDYPIAAGVVIGTVAVTRAAVVGAYYYSLPPSGCTVVVKNGVSYSYCGTVYYQRTWYGNDVVYVVVNP